MYGKGTANLYNQKVMTGFPRQFYALSGTTTPYLAACYCPFSQRVYFSPFFKNSFLEYDPVTGEQNEYFFDANKAWPGVNPTVAQYSYSIIATPQGKVIAIPYFSPTILILDTTTKEITYITGLLAGQIGKYYGANVANDGNIYFHSYAATQMLKVNLTTGLVTLFGDTTGVTTHLIGVYGEDNAVYQMPYPNPLTTIRRTDLSTGQVTFLNVLPSTTYLAACNTLDGRICIIPADTDKSVVLFNPVDNSVELLPINVSPSIGTGIGCKPGPNGNIYAFAGGRMFEIIPSKGIVNVLDTTPYQIANVATQGCAMTPQGIVFLSWSPNLLNKIITISNIGEMYPEMFTFPANIADISVSPWNKFHQIL
jgi:hypothetical protein